MKHCRIYSAAAAALLCATPALADGPQIVECEAPPPWVSEDIVKCYTAACNTLLIDLAGCSGNPICLNAARAVYHAELVNCMGNRTERETSSDLVVWFNTESGRWEISWPGEPIQAFTPRFEFNL